MFLPIYMIHVIGLPCSRRNMVFTRVVMKRLPSTQRLLLAAYVVLALSTSSVVLGKSKPHDVSGENHVKDEMCPLLVKRIFYSHVTVPSPPNNEGEWTSERCEVRPGPEYVLRKYRFEKSVQRFSAHIFHYADADCSSPLYLIRAAGSYSLMLESWTVPGGTEVDYELEEVSVMMYTAETASHLGAKINATCPGLHLSWEPYQHYVIFAFAGGGEGEEAFEDHPPTAHEDGMMHDEGILMDNDCTASLYFSFHELQLMRLEERNHATGSRSSSSRVALPVRMLYLGDIHTDRKQRQTYRPTSYQPPLLPADQEECSVCRALMNSDDYYPPSLKRAPPPSPSPHPVLGAPPLQLAGEWFSERCETRPNGMFLTRHLAFATRDYTWEGSYYHYVDALCRIPTFTIYAAGTYTAGKASARVGRSYNYDFRVSKVKITPGDSQIVAQLRKQQATCGGGSDVDATWEVGEERDVSNEAATASRAGGCEYLGIRVPHVEYEIVRVEKDRHKGALLYLGQRPSDGGHLNTPERRPTSFQSPLVKCARPLTVTPPTVRKSYDHQRTTSGAAGSASAATWVWILKVFIICSVSLLISQTLLQGSLWSIL